MAVSAEHIQTESNPFSDHVDEQNYFEDEARTEIARKIAHLLEYGSDILFIHGESESGKTTLIKHLIEQKGSEWLCCFTTATESNSVNSFLAVLARHFGINDDRPEGVLDKLAQQLTEAHEKGRFAVLFVDDADKLDPSLFKLIESISTIAIAGSPVLRIGLIGREIPLKLKEMVATSNHGSQMTITEIHPFTEEQTGVYVHHRLAVAGSNQQGIFTPAVVNKIYKQSRGQPSHINALAYSKLTQSENAQHAESLSPKMTDSSSNNHFVLKLIAMALAISVVVSLFFFRSEQKQEPTSTANVQEKTPLVLPQPEPADEAPVIPPKMIPEPPPVAQTPKSSADVELKPAVSQEGIKQAITPPTDKIQTETTAPVSNEAKPLEWRTEQWILERPGKNLTLQLIALGSAEAAQKFIIDNQLNDQAAFFKTMKQNKIFYAVIFGEFSSRNDAQKAAQKLPRSLNKIKPWIRSYASIQKAGR